MRPETVLIHFQKAIAKGDWPRALQAADALIEMQPGSSSLQYNRGLILKNLDRLPEALAAFDMTLRLDPSHVNACFERGSALFNLGRFDEAASAFRHYLEGSPDDADAALNLGLALLRLGDANAARQALRTAHELTGSTRATLALATAERDCGDLDAMETRIAELDHADPEIAAAILKLRTQGACGRLSLKVENV